MDDDQGPEPSLSDALEGLASHMDALKVAHRDRKYSPVRLRNAGRSAARATGVNRAPSHIRSMPTPGPCDAVQSGRKRSGTAEAPQEPAVHAGDPRC